MRLLPRSRRGIWLFAAAAWCSACAGLWWALPVEPRATLRLPRTHDLLAVLPGGERGVVAKRIRGEFGHEHISDLELVELPSGRSIQKLGNYDVSLDLFNFWKHCGFALVREGPKEDEKWHLLNLAEFSLTPVSANATDFPIGAAVPSADGRFGITSVDWREREIQIWDFQNNRSHGTLPGLNSPYGFTAGRSLLAATSFSASNKVSVIDLKSLSTLATLDVPENMRAIMACFSDDERYLVAALVKADEEKYSPPFPLVCWNLSTGQVEDRVRDLRDQPVGMSHPDSFLFVTQHFTGGPPLNCMALDKPWIPNADRDSHWELSPRSRILFVKTDEYGGFFENLLNRFGIAWPIHSDASIVAGFYDAASGRPLGHLRVWKAEHARDDFHWPTEVEWSPTCETLAIFESGSNNTWQIWDIPPRKSLTRFAAGATLLALPIGFVAWRRGRKLRSA